MPKTRVLKVQQGTQAKHLHPATVLRIQQRRKEIPSAMIESICILPNGATFTKLRPAYANGTESAEDWKLYRRL